LGVTDSFVPASIRKFALLAPMTKAAKAITRSRTWVKQLMDGLEITEFARDDSRSERQIRLLLNLAFIPPKQVRELLDGIGPFDTITVAARRVPLLWSEAGQPTVSL
jgi:hypothetical protein